MTPAWVRLPRRVLYAAPVRAVLIRSCPGGWRADTPCGAGCAHPLAGGVSIDARRAVRPTLPARPVSRSTGGASSPMAFVAESRYSWSSATGPARMPGVCGADCISCGPGARVVWTGWVASLRQGGRPPIMLITAVLPSVVALMRAPSRPLHLLLCRPTHTVKSLVYGI